MARALTGILPKMSVDKALEVTRIYFVSDKLNSDTPLMRQPQEEVMVTISRAQGSLTFPDNFQLVGAMNP
jgi:predicted ATPase with chaperone activity